MSSGFVRRAWVGVLVALGVVGQCHAGPTHLDDAPVIVDGGGSKLGAGTSNAPSARASEPSSESVGAGVGRVKRSFTEDSELRLEPSGGTFSAGPIGQAQPTAVPDSLAQRPGRGESPAHQGEDYGVIKELASSATGWMREMLPWTASKAVATGRDASVPADLGALPMETDNTRSFSIQVDRAAQAADAAAVTGGANVSMPGEQSPDRRPVADPSAANSVHHVVKVARELLAHPLTWLVIVLLGIAQIVVSRAGRRK